MTFDDIVTEIMDRLNLTSDEATTRVGRRVNRVYRKVLSSIGVSPIAMRVFGIDADTVVGAQEVAFEGMHRVTRVYDANQTPRRDLDEVSIDELRETDAVESDTPTKWALVSAADGSVTIMLDKIPETEFTLTADGYGTTGDLSGDDEPSFPEIYHDVLVDGVLKDEYRKLEKTQLAADSRTDHENMLSDLRMWGAKQAYLKIRQGERSKTRAPRTPSN